jgi:hypothetical protein
MRKSFLILALLVCASVISAQTDSNSVTVTASRSTTFQADQALFGINVTSSLNTSLDDVLAALQGSGITIANFSGLYNSQFYYPVSPPDPTLPPPMLQWSFGLVAPLSKIKDTIGSLTSLQQNVAKKNSGLSLTFQIQGSQASAAAQQSQTCSLSDLIADARAKAQKMVDAAGLGVGVVLAMSSTTNVASSAIQFYPGPFAAPCSLTVKFALQRF